MKWRQDGVSEDLIRDRITRSDKSGVCTRCFEEHAYREENKAIKEQLLQAREENKAIKEQLLQAHEENKAIELRAREEKKAIEEQLLQAREETKIALEDARIWKTNLQFNHEKTARPLLLFSNGTNAISKSLIM